MRVFLGWSGERSHQVAVALRGWLKDVIQVLDPWLSEEDIEKGAPWFGSIADQGLNESSAGVLCMTPENVESLWIQFEAGALLKTVGDDKKRVCPYLLDMRETDLKGALGHLQVTLANEADTRRLVSTLNSAPGEEKLLVEEKTLDRSFKKFWPDLEGELARVRSIQPPKKAPTRPVPEVLEEILNRIRAIERTFPSSQHSSPSAGATRGDLEDRLRWLFSPGPESERMATFTFEPRPGGFPPYVVKVLDKSAGPPEGIPLIQREISKKKPKRKRRK